MVCVFSLTYIIAEQICCDTISTVGSACVTETSLSPIFPLWVSQLKLFSCFLNDLPGVANIDRLVWHFSWLAEALLLRFIFGRALYQ